MDKLDTITTSPRSKQKKPVRFYETWTFLILFCILVPLLIRTFLYSPFHIPSGSMKSTLLIGDYIFVSKFAYGYSNYSFPFSPDLFEGRIWESAPERGDVIVFRLPSNPRIDYIKRLIGLPGDVVQMKDGVLYLNREPIPQEVMTDFREKNENGELISIPRFKETLPGGVSHEVLDEIFDGNLDNTPAYIIPKEHYFFMGDNRDNSQDSRVTRKVGFVHKDFLIGRAEIIFISTEDALWKIWKWFFTMRPERIFTKIH